VYNQEKGIINWQCDLGRNQNINGIVVVLAGAHLLRIATQGRIVVCRIEYRHMTTGMLCDLTKTNVARVPLG